MFSVRLPDGNSHGGHSIYGGDVKLPEDLRRSEELRLSRALRLLRESPATIAEVALTTGFADQSYFDRRFKAAFGKTPNQIRRSTEGQKAAPADKPGRRVLKPQFTLEEERQHFCRIFCLSRPSAVVIGATLIHLIYSVWR
jgi:Helix-turn-helix domain